MPDRCNPDRSPLSAVVLAGERPTGSPLAQAFSVPAGVLVPVAGRPAIARVFAALRASRSVNGGLLCGPERAVMAEAPALQALLAPGDFRWLAPQHGPAASAMAALTSLERYPALVTTGDHALLSPETLDDFCTRAQQRDEDVLVGLVPYDTVMAAFPETRRTALRFADAAWCGSNLFLFRTRAGLGAANFWREVEASRKRPWKIARHLGLGLLLRYLSHRLSLTEALAAISERAGCRVGHVVLSDPRAAVDVDSIDDQNLAERLLESDRVGDR